VQFFRLFKVAINAKGGDCWHVYRQKAEYLFVIDGKINTTRVYLFSNDSKINSATIMAWKEQKCKLSEEQQ
jgi:hypothetical protein